jgi:uncharacterized damage-inducible protein DinB
MKRISAYLFLSILLLAPAAWAQGNARDEALRNFSDAGDKLVRLAEKMPAEKYTWRPGEGVRSVGEVYLHAAAGNFNLSRRLGATVPEGIQLGAGFEKQTTEKDKIVALLKQSVEHVKAAIQNVADADVEKTAPWFGGRQAALREIMFFIASHNHEHLGQSIAYARVNGVVPPWTEEAQQRQQQQPPKQPSKQP